MTADPNRCPLFVELCAGTAALSLRLHHPRARPPVSRMGAKTGYADVILRCMGLRPGQGSADGTRYLWCEPDKGVRLLLHAYRDRALALAAAQVIRGWADEEPRALWERLRAEGPAVCPPVDARQVARFLYGSAASYGGPKGLLWDSFLHPEKGGRYGAARADVADKTAALPTVEATITADARDIDPREVARTARLLTANRLINLDPETWRNTGEGGTTHGGAEFCTPAAALADAVEGVPEVPGAVVDDARAVDPREVARFGLLQGGCYNNYPIDVKTPYPDYNRFPPKGNWPVSIGEAIEEAATIDATITDDARAVDPREVARWSWIAGFAYNNLPVWDHGEGLRMGNHRGPGNEWREQEAKSKSGKCETGVQSPAFMVDRFQALPEMPARLTADARAVDPPQLPPGVVAYIDPPYENCTGYSHVFPRGAWLPIVRRWAEAGALVVVSEAEPIPELMAEGWYAVEITGERKGQKRTFSKQQREWLTMSRPPAWRPSEQMGLF